MKKEIFIKRMTAILDFSKKQEDLNDAIDKFTDGGAIVTIGDSIIKELLDSIKEAMKIEDSDLLSWWLWEDVEKVIYCENKEFKVQTLEELYDYIETF